MINIIKARKYARCIACFASEYETKLYQVEIGHEGSNCTQCITLCNECLEELKLKIEKK